MTLYVTCDYSSISTQNTEQSYDHALFCGQGRCDFIFQNTHSHLYVYFESFLIFLGTIPDSILKIITKNINEDALLYRDSFIQILKKFGFKMNSCLEHY